MESLSIGSHCNVTFEHHHTTVSTELKLLTLQTFATFNVKTRGNHPTTLKGSVLDLRSGALISSNDLHLDFVNITVHPAAEITVSEGLPQDSESGIDIYFVITCNYITYMVLEINELITIFSYFLI